MTDASWENYTLVVTVTFLSAFFILVSTMPIGLMPQGYEGKTVNVPEYFEAIDIQKYAETYTMNMTSGKMQTNFDLGGWKFLWWSENNWGATYPHSWICIVRYDSWWIFSWYAESGKWYETEKGLLVSESGNRIALSTHYWDYITKETLDKYYQANNSVVSFTVKFNPTQFDIYFAFNTTKYSKPSEAWDNGDLHALIGINFDQRNTTFNAWNIIGALLFFKMPNVHPAINMLIAIPIWVMIAWLIYILILKAIPFVGG